MKCSLGGCLGFCSHNGENKQQAGAEVVFQDRQSTHSANNLGFSGALLNGEHLGNTSFHALYARYIPFMVRQKFLSGKPIIEPYFSRFEGVVGFVDISGFTKLSMHLMETYGVQGAELLNKFISSYFDKLINVIIDFGGDIIKFAGDAMLVVWKSTNVVEDIHVSSTVLHRKQLTRLIGHGEEHLGLLVMRALACNLELLNKLNNFEPTEGITLQLHCGIGCGLVSELYVGGVDNIWEFFVAGDPIREMSSAGDEAKSGEIVLSPRSYELVKTSVGVGKVLKSGNVSVSTLIEAPVIFKIPPPHITPQMEHAMTGFVPPIVMKKTAQGAVQGWLAEFRKVYIIFIALEEMDYSVSDVLKQLQAAVTIVQECVFKYEGCVARLLADDKGTRFKIAFGMPTLAHEDDGVRCVRAGLEIQKRLRLNKIDCSMGTASGMAYCGEAGSGNRCEYTAVGAKVVIAARLMQKAGMGGSLVDEETQIASAHAIVFEKRPEVMLKGVANAVAVYRPHSVISGTKSEKTKKMLDLPKGKQNKKSIQASRRTSTMTSRTNSLLKILDKHLAGVNATVGTLPPEHSKSPQEQKRRSEKEDGLAFVRRRSMVNICSRTGSALPVNLPVDKRRASASATDLLGIKPGASLLVPPLAVAGDPNNPKPVCPSSPAGGYRQGEGLIQMKPSVANRRGSLILSGTSLNKNGGIDFSTNSKPINQLECVVGRDAEKEFIMRSFFKTRETGLSHTVIIEADGGMGKSAVIFDFLDTIDELSMNIQAKIPAVYGNGDLLEKRTPYFPFRTIFEQILGLKALDAEYSVLEERKVARRQRVLGLLSHSAQTDLTMMVVLVNDVLRTDFEETTFTRAMSPAGRAKNTQRILVALVHTVVELQQLSGDNQRHSYEVLVIVLEELQHIDSASWGLLYDVVTNVPNLMLILSTRALPLPYPVDFTKLKQLPTTSNLFLDDLSHEDAMLLACVKFGVKSLPDMVANAISQAHGHPLFIDELVLAMLNNQSVTVDTTKHELVLSDKLLQGGVSFPDSVQGVLVDRIDNLSAKKQLCVKVASVIGLEVNFDVIYNVHPSPGFRAELFGILVELCDERVFTMVESEDYANNNAAETSVSDANRLSITGPPKPTPPPEIREYANVSFIFKHVYFQEASYSMLPNEKRKEIHNDIVKYYHRHPALVVNYAIISYHAEKAEQWGDAVNYILLAGQVAAKASANHEVVKHFTHMQEILTKEPSQATLERRFACANYLGLAYNDMNNFLRSKEYTLQALAILGHNVVALKSTGSVKEMFWFERSVKKLCDRNRKVKPKFAHSKLCEVNMFGVCTDQSSKVCMVLLDMLVKACVHMVDFLLGAPAVVMMIQLVSEMNNLPGLTVYSYHCAAYVFAQLNWMKLANLCHDYAVEVSKAPSIFISSNNMTRIRHQEVQFLLTKGLWLESQELAFSLRNEYLSLDESRKFRIASLLAGVSSLFLADFREAHVNWQTLMESANLDSDFHCLLASLYFTALTQFFRLGIFAPVQNTLSSFQDILRKLRENKNQQGVYQELPSRILLAFHAFTRSRNTSDVLSTVEKFLTAMPYIHRVNNVVTFIPPNKQLEPVERSRSVSRSDPKTNNDRVFKKKRQDSKIGFRSRANSIASNHSKSVTTKVWAPFRRKQSLSRDKPLARALWNTDEESRFSRTNYCMFSLLFNNFLLGTFIMTVVSYLDGKALDAEIRRKEGKGQGTIGGAADKVGSMAEQDKQLREALYGHMPDMVEAMNEFADCFEFARPFAIYLECRALLSNLRVAENLKEKMKILNKLKVGMLQAREMKMRCLAAMCECLLGMYHPEVVERNLHLQFTLAQCKNLKISCTNHPLFPGLGKKVEESKEELHANKTLFDDLFVNLANSDDGSNHGNSRGEHGGKLNRSHRVSSSTTKGNTTHTTMMTHSSEFSVLEQIDQENSRSLFGGGNAEQSRYGSAIEGGGGGPEEGPEGLDGMESELASPALSVSPPRVIGGMGKLGRGGNAVRLPETRQNGDHLSHGNSGNSDDNPVFEDELEIVGEGVLNTDAIDLKMGKSSVTTNKFDDANEGSEF